MVAAYLIDDLPHDDRYVLVSVMPFAVDPYTRVDRLDVYSGRRVQVARAPVRNASFVTDNAGVVRFATGSGLDNMRKLYYRTGDGAEWQLIRKRTKRSDSSGRSAFPLTIGKPLSRGRTGARPERRPHRVRRLSRSTGARKQVLRDDVHSTLVNHLRNGTVVPLGAFLRYGRASLARCSSTRPCRKRSSACPDRVAGDVVRITSQTADGRLALVERTANRNPATSTFSTPSRRRQSTCSAAAIGLIRMPWRRCGRSCLMRATESQIHGISRRLPGPMARGLPLIATAQWGPFGIRDDWGFDTISRCLRMQAMRCCSVNFRGSGGYGPRSSMPAPASGA